jgi:hypothetical protein
MNIERMNRNNQEAAKRYGVVAHVSPEMADFMDPDGTLRKAGLMIEHQEIDCMRCETTFQGTGEFCPACRKDMNGLHVSGGGE